MYISFPLPLSHFLLTKPSSSCRIVEVIVEKVVEVTREVERIVEVPTETEIVKIVEVCMRERE